MKRKLLPLLFALMIGFALPVVALAQDDLMTNTPQEPAVTEVTSPTAEATEMVGVPPVATNAPPTETAPLPENPRGGLTLNDWLPYLVPIIIVGILALSALFGGVVFALWKSVPSGVKPIVYPMLQSGGEALIGMADNYVKTTKSTADDNLVSDLRQEFNTKLKAMYEEMQAQRVADAKVHVNAIQDALQNGHLVG